MNLIVAIGTWPRTLRALKGFKLATPPSEKAPVPWVLALAMAAHLLQAASDAATRAALGLLLQFDTYLRPGEMLKLRGQDVIAPRGHVRTWSIVVAPVPDTAEGSTLDLQRAMVGMQRAAPSKTQVYDNTIAVGERASSDAGREFIPKLLRHLCRLRPGSTPLIGLTHAQYAQQLAAASRALRLPAVVTPHCLRHAGPSADAALALRSLEQIKSRGMWAKDSSLARYRRPGKYHRALAALPQRILDAAIDNRMIIMAALSGRCPVPVMGNVRGKAGRVKRGSKLAA